MPNKVFVLGAGASRHTGAPLMWDFLDRARDIYAAGSMAAVWHEHFSRVFKAISALQVVHSKSSLDIRNLESVFTTFEMAQNLGHLGALPVDDVRLCVQSLQAVIFYTLDQCVLFPTTPITGELLASDVYAKFAQCIHASDRDNITLITFNYDVALDFALARLELDIEYGLEGPTKTFGRVIRLLKLHGSLNWATTKETKTRLVFCPPSALAANPMATQPKSRVPLNLINRLKKLIQDRHSVEINDLPVLVPPGLYKTEYQGILTEVWRTAADALKNADEIYVFGYSLPETDFFFQNLYALGTVGEKLLRRFEVFDPNPAIESRFERLLGPGARDVFHFTKATFDDGAAVGLVAEDGKPTANFFNTLTGPPITLEFGNVSGTHRESPPL